MKRTTFTLLGLATLAFTACNFSSPKEVTQEKVSVATTIPMTTETTSEFEAKALEECIAIAQRMDDIKLMEAQEKQRLNDSLVEAEKALKDALAKSIAAKKKKARTPAQLAKGAREAELWFQENYAAVMEKYDFKYKGVKIKFATNGKMYDVQTLVNGEWKKDEKLFKILEKVEVTKDLYLGNAVSITVSKA